MFPNFPEPDMNPPEYRLRKYEKLEEWPVYAVILYDATTGEIYDLREYFDEEEANRNFVLARIEAITSDNPDVAVCMRESTQMVVVEDFPEFED